MSIVRVMSAPWRIMHAYVATSLIWWGVVLAVPGSTFNVSRAYGAMQAFASEEAWAAVLATIGTLHMLSLFRPPSLFSVAAPLLSAMALILIAGSFGFSAPLTTGTGTYALSAIVALTVMIREARAYPA